MPLSNGSTVEKLQINIDKDAHGSFNLEVAQCVCGVNNNIWHFLELSMCHGLVSSTDLFLTIFESLLLIAIVDGSNWIIAFHEVMKRNGSCHSGECHHTSPHYNSNTDLGNICHLLVMLHWLVEDINKMDLPPNDTDKPSKKQYHDTLSYAISVFQHKGVFHNISSMMGQHILLLLIKSGVIKFPALSNYMCFHQNTKSYAWLIEMIRKSQNKSQMSNVLCDVSA
jgi:hypothetical protein